MYGCEMVWPWPIGSAVSSYARLASASSTNRCRGTLRIRSSTSGLTMPCSRRRATSRSRVRAEVMPIPLTLLWSFTPASVVRSFRAPGKPLADLAERGMARQVDLQRRDRDVAAGHRVEIGALAGVGALARRADPVDRSAARIAGPHHRRRTVPVPQARGADAAQTFVRKVRHVD